MKHEQDGLRIDIGCGAVKKSGTIGIDKESSPGVDYVLDIEKQPLPFEDRSVSYVHSSHFLEHLKDPTPIFSEISRVAKDNARLEIWTPYAWSNSAFIIDHKFFFTEEIYFHMCVWFTDFWENILQGRWVLNEIQYSIDPTTLLYLSRKQISLDFALRHLHDVVREFCIHITVIHTKPYPAPSLPRRTFSTSRTASRYEVKPDEYAPVFGLADQSPASETLRRQTEDAIRMFAQGKALPPRE